MYFITLWLAESECYWNCKAASRESVRVSLHTLSDSCLVCSLCNLCDCRLPSVHLRSPFRSLQTAVGRWARPSAFRAASAEKGFSIFKQPCLVGWTAELPEWPHTDSGGPKSGNACCWLVDNLILQMFSRAP